MDLAKIHERMGQVESYKEKNKIARLTLKEELEINEEYQKVGEQLKALLEKRKRIKNEIWTQIENQKLVSDIKENKEELDTLEEILSSELMEYYQENKATEIEDSSGEKRQFKLVAKLLPKKKKYEEREVDGRFASQIDPSAVNKTSPQENYL